MFRNNLFGIVSVTLPQDQQQTEHDFSAGMVKPRIAAVKSLSFVKAL